MLSTVVKNVHVLFKQQKYPQGCRILQEGKLCEDLYVIEKGTASICKNIKYQLEEGELQERKKELKVKTISEGEFFGEENLCFSGTTNTYSIVVESANFVVR